MRSSRVASTLSLSLCLVLGLVLTAGCTSKDGGGGGDGGSTSAVGYDFPVEAGKYTVLGILTDNKDHSRAKSNAEDTLSKYPDVAGMVGLWAYNPPAILLAVKAVQKEGKIQIIGFDEHPETLEAKQNLEELLSERDEAKTPPTEDSDR